MSSIRATYIAAAESVVDLLGAPEVEQRWEEMSVLPAFRVSGLSGHLARAIFTVHNYLESSAPGLPPVDAATYFALLEDTDDISGSMNMTIRSRGEEVASEGASVLAELASARLDDLREMLATAPSDRRVKVFGNQVMMLDEYLKTRLVEIVVHVEDLALSVNAGVGLPTEAITIATDVVVAAARRRHGDLALLRGMTRRERDEIEATRLF